LRTLHTIFEDDDDGFMKKIIICIILIYSLYFIQIHLLIQNIYALAPLLKTWNKNTFFDSTHYFYTYISIMPSQPNIEITKTMSQVTPDRYIPPPPIISKSTPSTSITSLPSTYLPLQPSPSSSSSSQQQQQLYNHSDMNKYQVPLLPQQTNISPDRYIPPPILQQSAILSNLTMFNPLQNISSLLYNQINLDIDKGKTLFSALHDICTFPLVHYICNVDLERLPPKYNLDNIKSISTIAKDSLEEYKKNSTNLAGQRFKQANLNLTNCLNGLSFNTQNQLHSLLGSQGQNAVQNIANTLKIDDVVQSIIYDFVKVGSINEKLGIRPDSIKNKCL
jgi:hypothetical protein